MSALVTLMVYMGRTVQSTVPSSDDPVVVDLSESTPICETNNCTLMKICILSISVVDSNVVFWAPEVNVGEVAAFQISLTASPRLPISSLPFSMLAIHFSHSDAPVIIRRANSGPSSRPSTQRIDLGHINASDTPQEVVADLQWELGECKVLSGTISSDLPSLLKVQVMHYIVA